MQLREMALEGAFNWRDLGGVVTAEGYEVRRGKIFRADALHKLTDNDLETLATLNVTTVFDFRSATELAQTGRARLVERGARYVNEPLSNYDPARPIVAMHATMGESYRDRARNDAHLFGNAVNQLALAENLPAVIHCAGGKDRTGITAAAIYMALGVDQATIIADYVLTDIAMERVLANMPEANRERLKGYPPSFLRAAPENIEALLDTIETEFGGPQGWLRHAGVSQGSIESLRKIMLQ